ncbi:envelope stress response membrane protein PspC [Shewanella sp. SR43-4]|jgi:phage shock protein C|uniref:Envelope stress response membrane protein PspC n=1 Tax=Shewanella vesiculosa TaxID=518738 RepID=A0ABV0FRU3_9GAMM|nr:MULTISPECIES: envelope stress response membrane protein PspC [Shewanella]NCQ44000.1 envelope stress response membrane protein PspC [Shewanella frigidimarina]MBB1316671.1 envelope stress response membrane protein PspC [Shewanella sp. SR43-4]MBB1391736.1 envelope stress response membrane protein PspC [Shewanella sp. SG44-6]MBB1474595.1 envelope stress response membrane protein PspC [Shewanella sp. SG41-3]NCO70374.1 envelope stress response membrane protein PspC [Shewanella vesiculosa]|tara:strand:+ start:15082 stop:15477 length:396 start_codon:yes stop_codon:yes gene_type:complete
MSSANGRTLYRNPKSGKVAGVCSGLADYFNFETWLVRVIAVSILLLGGTGVVLVIYIALWMILDIKPQDLEHKEQYKDIEIKKKVWQAGEPAKQALFDVNRQFNGLEVRLRRLEEHVTSDNFDLKRQINSL